MKKSSNISDEDIALFRESVVDTKPLKQDSIIVNKPKPSPHPSKTEEDNLAVIEEMSNAEIDHSLLEEEMNYYLANRVFRDKH